MIIAACSSTKNSTSSSPTVVSKSSNGIYPPGMEELAAISTQYQDVTLDKLNQGHVLYTQGACTNCHNPKNIYRHGTSEWKGIMDDMAVKAQLSDTEKDAVYKYVLAIKMKQPK